MNERPKHEIEELFSAAVDGELTQRQQTELKRLLQRQPEMAEQLEALTRQRQLLCSLPVETAPSSLVEDIKACMERRMILDNAARTQSLRSRAALVRRRFVAAAAMLFLPLGLLGIVVYRIVTPSAGSPTTPSTVSELLRDDLRMLSPRPDVPATAAALPFDGLLTLTAERPMLAAQSIEKQIFLRAMEHQTVPNRTAEVITFQVDCPADTAADFIASLASLWEQLSGSRLTLRDVDAPERTVTIPHIRPEQIQTLVLQTDKMPMLAAARRYASSNVPLRPESGADDRAGTAPVQPVIPRPILAWPDREAAVGGKPLPTVRLTIEVRRPE